MKTLSAMLLCDFYKLSHRAMYPYGTEMVYSTWTPRSSRNPDIKEVVVFGHQAFIKEWLVDFFNKEFFNKSRNKIVADYVRVVKNTLGIKNPETKHIIELHDLGYLPLIIRAIPEGTLVPFKTPTLTVHNTHTKFFWLTNYIETLLSSELWPAYTAATLAYEYRKILDKAAMKTVGNTEMVQFQGHDFSMRGMMGVQAAVKTGMGHLLSFVGTDTIPAIQAIEYYYRANIEKELIGTSVPATEHSIQCAYGDDMRYLTQVICCNHPSGIVSVVSDGYDFWDVIGRVVPALKADILARDGKVVIRPDSGDPVKIICGDPDGETELERKGAIEALWDIFGGTYTGMFNAQGDHYKLLDSHIGLIYGDAITLTRAQEIVDKLAAKGFASINVIFGIGSYTYQYNTRDTFGFAMKSTLCRINGVNKMIFKCPKTDDGVKKSQRGAVRVFRDEEGKIISIDGLSLDSEMPQGLLKMIFMHGKMYNKESFKTIRKRLRNNLN